MGDVLGMSRLLTVVRIWFCLALALAAPLTIAAAPPAPATVTVRAGDVAGLVAAIRAANARPGAHTIVLEAGAYTLHAATDSSEGATGLPSITGRIRLVGAGANQTVIERAAGAPNFRILRVAANGTLTLAGLAIRGGDTAVPFEYDDQAAGILNHGRLIVVNARVDHNTATTDGGIGNLGGTVLLLHSTVSENHSDTGGGIGNDGRMLIVDSAISGNIGAFGGGIANTGRLLVVNTTLGNNRSQNGGGAIANLGRALVASSTLSANQAIGDHGGGDGGGIDNAPAGVIALINTVLAGNTSFNQRNVLSPDCAGQVLSLGHNRVGSLMGCTLALARGDRVVDPRLAAFTDDGTPGHGHFPLLPGSPAINAGAAAACLPADQLGQPRGGQCDIGAIEFQSHGAAVNTGSQADSAAGDILAHWAAASAAFCRAAGATEFDPFKN